MSKWYPCIYCTEDLRCEKYNGDGVISYCVLGPCTDETPSNADRIRAMTDEELAEFLSSIIYDYGGDQFNAEHYLDWLKQEATE